MIYLTASKSDNPFYAYRKAVDDCNDLIEPGIYNVDPQDGVVKNLPPFIAKHIWRYIIVIREAETSAVNLYQIALARDGSNYVAVRNVNVNNFSAWKIIGGGN